MFKIKSILDKIVVSTKSLPEFRVGEDAFPDEIVLEYWGHEQTHNFSGTKRVARRNYKATEPVILEEQ